MICLRALALCAFALLLAACRSQSTDDIREEISELKSEVRALKQLKYDLAAVQQDVAQLKQAGIPQHSGESAVLPVTAALDESSNDDPFLGNSGSSAVVMLFSDYQCNSCRKFYKESFSSLQTEFIDTNQVKFIFRDFPLSSNSQSRQAAIFASCAGEQGRYWEAFHLLYQQTDLVDAGNFSAAGARLGGLDNSRLLHCMEGKKYEIEIDRDIAEAKKLGAQGVPSFFIGQIGPNRTFQGVLVRGAQPYAVLKGEISKVLAIQRQAR